MKFTVNGEKVENLRIYHNDDGIAVTYEDPFDLESIVKGERWNYDNIYDIIKKRLREYGIKGEINGYTQYGFMYVVGAYPGEVSKALNNPGCIIRISEIREPHSIIMWGKFK